MTIKELIKELSKYDGDCQVDVRIGNEIEAIAEVTSVVTDHDHVVFIRGDDPHSLA